MDVTTLVSSANAAAAATAPAAAQTASASGSGTLLGGSSALSQLGQNFNQFLQLLLTQVQNQDPTSPTDTSQFTTELVQFTGVQQQVNTNTNLSQLIALQRNDMVLQSAGLVGHQATVRATSIPLQSGTGTLSFTGAAGQTASIAIVDAAGHPVRDAVMAETGGTNVFVWDGRDNAGNAVPDGAYRAAVMTDGGTGAAPSPLGFLVTGTATGISNNGTTTQVQLGALSVDISALQSISH